jgi:DNA-binding transcriptional regulator YiaG
MKDDARIDPLRLAAAQTAAKTGRARRIRESAGLSISDIARSVEIATATGSRWESGQRRPTGVRAVAWIDLLDALERQQMASAS